MFQSRAWWYVRRTASVAVACGLIGYASFYLVERGKPNYENHPLRAAPGSDEDRRRTLEQEARFEALFMDIQDDEKRRVYKRWGRSAPSSLKDDEKPKVRKVIVVKKKSEPEGSAN
eukprot:TRINITY_DN5310_c0_g1_i1.p1 TRINITY_DN5310_c0_g1~~TRINITY_DN5310_c0_g1_i1.p1  ORF type:complete len:116 (-),score=21.98 TRINITY_DN5310_c0_g1_i1:25-372(-)